MRSGGIFVKDDLAEMVVDCAEGGEAWLEPGKDEEEVWGVLDDDGKVKDDGVAGDAFVDEDLEDALLLDKQERCVPPDKGCLELDPQVAEDKDRL